MTQCEHPMVRCQMPPGHGDDVDCQFICVDCDAECQSEGRCIQNVDFRFSAEMPIPASTGQEPIGVPLEVSQAIGEIFVEYALAECTLRSLLKDLPGHNEMSTASEDLRRLERYLPDVLERTPVALRKGLKECVRNLRSSFDAVNNKRNVLAHGQLVGVTSIARSIVPTAQGQGIEIAPDESTGNTLRMEHERHGSVRLTGPEISGVLGAAKEFRRQVGSLARIADLRHQLGE